MGIPIDRLPVSSHSPYMGPRIQERAAHSPNTVEEGKIKNEALQPKECKT